MRLVIFSVLLLLGLAYSAPTSKDEALEVTDEFFPDVLKIYEGKHDIVKIVVPLNGLNFDENTSSDQDADETVLFFVEADIKDGVTTDQGLYIKKGDKIKKLLDNGHDIAAPVDDSKTAYFAAKDGLYVYNEEKNEAEKYGNIDDDLITVVVTNSTNEMYVLTATKEVYKISEDGTKKVKINDINDAEQLVVDFSNNIYYVDSNKKLFVVNSGGVKVIEGLPDNFNKITLIRPPFVLDDGIPVVVDKNTYSVYANGTVEKEDITIETEITAFSMEAALVQYYAHEKKIYEYNILALLLGDLLQQLSEFLENVKGEIQDVASKTRKQAIGRA